MYRLDGISQFYVLKQSIIIDVCYKHRVIIDTRFCTASGPVKSIRKIGKPNGGGWDRSKAG